jgi:hypothetical protein
MTALWAAFALQALGLVDAATGLLIQVAAIGYLAGRFHAAHIEAARFRRAAVTNMEAFVDWAGAVLAGDDDLDEEVRPALQHDRAFILDTLRLIDRPPFHKRALARLHR